MIRWTDFRNGQRLEWRAAACRKPPAPWYTGLVVGTSWLKASWYKSQEEASRLSSCWRAGVPPRERNNRVGGPGERMDRCERCPLYEASGISALFHVLLVVCRFILHGLGLVFPSENCSSLNGFLLVLEETYLCFQFFSSRDVFLCHTHGPMDILHTAR